MIEGLLWPQVRSLVQGVPWSGLLTIGIVLAIVLWIVVYLSVPQRRRGGDGRRRTPGRPPPARRPRVAGAWYFKSEGAVGGPFHADGLAVLYGQNTISDDTPVWQKGMRAWRPLRAIPALRRELKGS